MSWGDPMNNRLKQLRKERKLTQVELQMRTGIEQSLLSKFENGERIPPTETLVILADFYNVSIDYILCRTENPSINKWRDWLLLAICRNPQRIGKQLLSFGSLSAKWITAASRFSFLVKCTSCVKYPSDVKYCCVMWNEINPLTSADISQRSYFTTRSVISWIPTFSTYVDKWITKQVEALEKLCNFELLTWFFSKRIVE